LSSRGQSDETEPSNALIYKAVPLGEFDLETETIRFICEGMKNMPEPERHMNGSDYLVKK